MCRDFEDPKFEIHRLLYPPAANRRLHRPGGAVLRAFCYEGHVHGGVRGLDLLGYLGLKVTWV